ncbi:MAG: hypothetical protein E5X05_01170 [Mesorhizobium sp.]|nr:MAG: hypothetical protein E5X05_01170 [Mesorhizobium sp.]
MDNLSDKSFMAKERVDFPKWPEIEATAKKLGAGEEAIRKWRQRGVIPGKWHVPLIVQSRGRLSVKDFAQKVPA